MTQRVMSKTTLPVLEEWPAPAMSPSAERDLFWRGLAWKAHPSKNRWETALRAARWTAAAWDREARNRLRFLDPCCGSGTFPVAALEAGWPHVAGWDLRRRYVEITRCAVGQYMNAVALLGGSVSILQGDATERIDGLAAEIARGARPLGGAVLSPDFGPQLHNPGSAARQRDLIAARGLGAGHHHEEGDLPGDFSGRIAGPDPTGRGAIAAHRDRCARLYRGLWRASVPGARVAVVVRDMILAGERVELGVLHRDLLVAAGFRCAGAARVPARGGYYQAIRRVKGAPTVDEEWVLLAEKARINGSE